MEPVEHMLMGAVLARAGFNRRARYATAAMAIAAEFPDYDTVWGLRGPLCGFAHHRGISHTFVGIPVEAAVLTAGFYAWHRWRARYKAPEPKGTPSFSWAWLFGGTLLALGSHLLLDWTNNYGIRPFFPFDPRWFAGSFVFIVEPLLLGVLVLALVLPALFGLINGEIGVQRPALRGRGAAWAALLCVAALYAVRMQQHGRALQLAQTNTAESTRVFASPHPVNPFLWSTIADTGTAYQLATVHTLGTGEIEPPVPADTLAKPQDSTALASARRSELGHIYLDWSLYPVLSETPDTSDPDHPLTIVTFSDARFMFNAALMHGREHPPISGSVLLDTHAPESQRVVETRFDGKVQH